ncbi:hypothetical protein FDP51_05025 [Enterococcus mundtii]|uniref:hypothetical protein n=1 Tax=Enterococcus mundtii TaxID=53346 RepID=UPI00129C656F|nr:hypothetical protein [Enterococcus mundtii]MRI73386.1 hypothetical protein [Enterococcus mundtii]
MIRPLQKTTKFYATTREEAETEIAKMLDETKGSILKQNIVAKNHKDFGDYYEAQVTEEFARSKEIVEGGFLA